MKKIISMNVDDKVYASFLKYCQERGMIMSRLVENFMDKKVKDEKK